MFALFIFALIGSIHIAESFVETTINTKLSTQHQDQVCFGCNVLFESFSNNVTDASIQEYVAKIAQTLSVGERLSRLEILLIEGTIPDVAKSIQDFLEPNHACSNLGMCQAVPIVNEHTLRTCGVCIESVLNSLQYVQENAEIMAPLIDEYVRRSVHYKPHTDNPTYPTLVAKILPDILTRVWRADDPQENCLSVDICLETTKKDNEESQINADDKQTHNNGIMKKETSGRNINLDWLLRPNIFIDVCSSCRVAIELIQIPIIVVLSTPCLLAPNAMACFNSVLSFYFPNFGPFFVSICPGLGLCD